MSAIEVENVIMNDRISTAKFYERALDVIEEKDISGRGKTVIGRTEYINVITKLHHAVNA